MGITTKPKVVPNVIPWLRYLTFLCHQIWDNQNKIGKIKELPVLMLVGAKDELVPPTHLQKLFTILKRVREGGFDDSAPKSNQQNKQVSKRLWLVTFPDGSHNDTCMQDGYFEAIFDFWKEYVM